MIHMKLEEYAPGEIEKRSFAIIEEELGRELDPVQKPIIKRVIHTTADFSYADTLFFSEGAVEEGLNALRSGVSIVTDTNMGKAGINKKKLGQLGGSVHCFMADEDIAREAKERKCTRAVASMEKAVRLFGAPEGNNKSGREYGKSGRNAGGFYFCHRERTHSPYPPV